jgi:hypothetical protein
LKDRGGNPSPFFLPAETSRATSWFTSALNPSEIFEQLPALSFWRHRFASGAPHIEVAEFAFSVTLETSLLGRVP